MNAPKGPARHYLEAGTVIGDRYEIRRRLGSGGIGDVYKAADTHLGNRTVALKMLSTTVVAGPLADEVRGRFMLEAQALSAIRDDHVVSVLNFGFTGEDVPYLVMEFLEGQDLESLLTASGGSLSIEHAVDVALDVCGGVYICHNEEIVHRDLKPANIFLEKTPRGDRAKVVDFGISKSAASAKLSRPGIAMGTPKYMAPEQLARGQTDARSDQYSIGLILYRCLTGRLPDKGGGPDAKDVRPAISVVLNEAVMQALAQDPEARFPSVYEFGRQLLLLASEQASARWREFYRTLRNRNGPSGLSRSRSCSRSLAVGLIQAPFASTTTLPGVCANSTTGSRRPRSTCTHFPTTMRSRSRSPSRRAAQPSTSGRSRRSPQQQHLRRSYVRLPILRHLAPSPARNLRNDRRTGGRRSSCSAWCSRAGPPP